MAAMPGLLRFHLTDQYLHPEGTGSEVNTIKLWDVTTKQLIATLGGHRGGVFSVAFSPDGTILASTGAYDDSPIKLWDITTKQPIATLSHTDISGAWSIAFSPDGTILASGIGKRIHI